MRYFRITTFMGFIFFSALTNFGYGADFGTGMAAYLQGDYNTALGVWRSLAQKGDARAQYSLGMMYNDGEGVPKSDKMAATWYLKAARQGHAKAQYNLGVAYYSGKGVPHNYTEAAAWIRKAAKQGDVIAQTVLGAMYGKGNVGVPKSDVYAYAWCNIAAAHGDDLAKKCRSTAQNLMTVSEIAEAQLLSRELFEEIIKDY